MYNQQIHIIGIEQNHTNKYFILYASYDADY